MEFARVWATLVIVVTCLAAVSPLVPELRGRKGDSFPLSWYPMFAKERPKLERPTHVVGVTESGDRVKVDISFWSSGGFNQGRNELTTTVEQGPARLDKLCARIARKVVDRDRKEHRDVVELWIVKGKYDRAKYFEGDHTPIEERTLTTCPVRR